MELISSIDVSPDTIAIRANERFAQEYLRDDFRVKYEIAGGDPSIDEELAAVPFLANVAPVVWLAGLDVQVPALDAVFATALADVRAAFAAMYPALRWDGSITANRLRSVDGSAEQLALLFSGGVDSVYSSMSIDRDQLLVTVRGADIALDNDRGWEAVRGHAVEFGRARNQQNAFIETNFRRFLNLATLGHRWPALADWWGRVQHGLGLLGLVAPLIGNGRVIIAATHTPAVDVGPWGSNPALDTSVRWGNVKVDHHGYGHSRQEKVESIVARGEPRPRLRVCFSDPYGAGGNCGTCEKCLRTFAGLLVAGADPIDYGMPVSRADGARMLRRRFATYRVPIGPNQAWHWRRIQESCASKEGGSSGRPDETEVARTLHWLSTFDFEAYERHWRLPLRARRRLFRIGRHFPAAERAGRRLLAASHRARREITARRKR